MSRRRIWKNKTGEKILPNPQKLAWKRKSTHDTFEAADKVRNELKKDNEYVKVNRTGPDGTQFKVLIGTKIKPKTEKKKEKKDATK